MDKSAQGQGGEGELSRSLVRSGHCDANLEQLSIAEERDRRRAYAIAGH